METLFKEYNEQSSIFIADSSYECHWDDQWYDDGWVDTSDE